MASPSTVTPKKRTKKNPNGGSSTSANTTPSKKAKVTPGKAIPIATSYEAAGPEDRMIIHMKDVENRNWAEIEAAWETMTGIKPSKGSLSTRYRRLKANFTVFNPEHVSIYCFF